MAHEALLRVQPVKEWIEGEQRIEKLLCLISPDLIRGIEDLLSVVDREDQSAAFTSRVGGLGKHRGQPLRCRTTGKTAAQVAG